MKTIYIDPAITTDTYALATTHASNDVLRNYADYIVSKFPDGSVAIYQGVIPYSELLLFTPADQDSLQAFVYGLFNEADITHKLTNLSLNSLVPAKWSFKSLKPHEVVTRLVYELANPSAYDDNGTITMEPATEIARRLIMEIVGDDGEDTDIIVTNQPWLNFFSGCGVARDSTWVFLNRRKKLFWLICTTDSD